MSNVAQEQNNLIVWAARCVRDGEPFPVDLEARIIEYGENPNYVRDVLQDFKEHFLRIKDIRDDQGTSVLDVFNAGYEFDEALLEDDNEDDDGGGGGVAGVTAVV